MFRRVAGDSLGKLVAWVRGTEIISRSASCRPPRRGLEKNDMIAVEGAGVIVIIG
jgi:hypothetical protein